MIKQTIKLTLWLLFVFTSRSHAISIIGNGIVTDSIEGFRTKITTEFSNTSELSKNGLRAEGPPLFGVSQWFTPQYIEMYPLREIYSQYINLSRVDFESELKGNGWSKVTSTDSCISAFYSSSASANTYVLSWGDSKGVVFTGPATDMVYSGLLELLKDLELEPGACGWR